MSELIPKKTVHRVGDLPMPEGSPEPGSCVRVERPELGLAWVVLDPPHRSATVLDLPLLRDLELVVDQLEQDEALRGVVITGRDPLHFAFGADVDAIATITERKPVEQLTLAVHATLRRLAALPVRTVAAVGGPVPGGAYELSLACDVIVASDHPRTRIGLPETKLGILPGWGGAHRLPRRVGVVAALPLILEGKLLPARPALKRGMIDRITDPAHLHRVAADLAVGREHPRPATRRRRVESWLVDRNPIALQLVESKARKQVEARTHGHYPALPQVIELVTASCRTSLKDAAAIEGAAVAELDTGKVSKNLASIFQASEAAKKLGKNEDGTSPAPVGHAAVIGAGVMGGGIASLFAERGTWTRLIDISRHGLDAALVDHQLTIGKLKKRRRLQAHEADAAIDRLDDDTELRGLGRSDLVVEAVAERLDVKREVLGKVAEQVASETILATNTSSLSVGAIAEGLPHPERVVGLHFFNPVRKMPLVEIVRHGEAGAGGTSEEVVRRVAALSLRLGKTPVVVKDVSGFLVNRLLGPYLDEALRLWSQGVGVGRLDHLLEHFGMPMGPLRLLDEVGFDIAGHAAQSLHEAYGERMAPTDALQPLLEEGDLGAKSGRGFYAHPAGKGRPSARTDLASFRRSIRLQDLTDEEVVDRCVLAMLGEAVRCLEEEVTDSPRELDLATVFGTGFAPFRGGLLRYADERGLAQIVETMRNLAEHPEVSERGGGAGRFAVPGLLAQRAESGGSLRG